MDEKLLLAVAGPAGAILLTSGTQPLKCAKIPLSKIAWTPDSEPPPS